MNSGLKNCLSSSSFLNVIFVLEIRLLLYKRKNNIKLIFIKLNTTQCNGAGLKFEVLQHINFEEINKRLLI